MIEIYAVIAGATLPFLIALLRRWVKLDRNQINGLALLVSFIVALIGSLIENGFSYEIVSQNILIIFGTSNLVYNLVIKNLDLDTRLEGDRG